MGFNSGFKGLMFDTAAHPLIVDNVHLFNKFSYNFLRRTSNERIKDPLTQMKTVLILINYLLLLSFSLSGNYKM